MQQAAQESATIQSVGNAGEHAVALAAQPPPPASSQPTSTTTQIQLGCLSHCFGTTTPDASTLATTQLVLSELSSLVPPSDPPSPQPSPGTAQTVTDQFSLQVQDGSAAATSPQVQTAAQASATMQVFLASVPSRVNTAPGAPQVVDQAQQKTWQLQIGCLFYCVDSQQVQQAQQTTTTSALVAGPAAATAVTDVQQSIWQLQVGCLAWCWDSTQLQTASAQSAPPPPPPAPAPGPGPGPAPPATPPAATSSSEPAASSGSAGGPQAPPPDPPVTPTTQGTVLLAYPHRTGLALLGGWRGSRRSARAQRLVAMSGSFAVSAPASAPRDATAKPVVRPRVGHRPSPHRNLTAAPSSRPPISSPSAQSEASASGDGPVNPLFLALAGVVCLAAVLARRATYDAVR